MKMLFKQRMFSWFDSYDIYDEYGNVLFTVKGKLSWGHKLCIYTSDGAEVGMVREVLFRFLPRFELYACGDCVGEISKEFRFFRHVYHIDFNGWNVDGNFMGWDYNITDSRGQLVASISKELLHWTDTYVIDVVNPGDALYALMVTLAIDAEKCSASN